MTFEKRDNYNTSIAPRGDLCQSYCNNMGGGESKFDTAHGQQEFLARKAKNEPSMPC